jgi:hypothetical protein
VALGLGRNMANDGMSVDVDAFALGLRDALSGAEQRLTQEEIRAEMVAFQERITPSARRPRVQRGEANAKAAAAFLATNGAATV